MVIGFLINVWLSLWEFYIGVRCRKIVFMSFDMNLSCISFRSFDWIFGYIIFGCCIFGCCIFGSVWWCCIGVDVNILVFFVGVFIFFFGIFYLDVKVFFVFLVVIFFLWFDLFIEFVLDVYIEVLGVFFLGNILDCYEFIVGFELVVWCGICWRFFGDGGVCWVCVRWCFIFCVLFVKCSYL